MTEQRVDEQAELSRLEEALEHHQAGRLSEAERGYRRVLESSPENPDALNLLGVLAHQRGAHQAAIDLIARAMAVAPDIPEYHNTMGEALRALGRLDDAEAAFREALRLEPGFVGAHNNLGNTLHELGNLTEAVAAYREAIALEPGLAEIHYNLGKALHGLEMFAEARAAYSRAVSLGLASADLQCQLGDVLVEEGAFDEAVVAYRQAIALQPDSLHAHVNLGNALRGQEEPDRALDAYQAALRIEPRWAAIHYNIGYIHREQDRPEEAIAAFERALEFDPSHVDTYNNLGRTLFAIGRLDEAIAVFEKGLARDLRSASTRNNLGLALQSRGRLTEAVHHHRRAISLDPDFAAGHNNLGLALQKEGRLDDAIEAHRRALEIDPDYAIARNSLGNTYHLKGRLAEAIAEYRFAISLKEDYAEAYNNLGNALVEQGEVEGATEAYRQALAHRPDDSGAYSNLLFSLNYRPDRAPAEVAAEHRAWAARHAPILPGGPLPHDNDPSPDRRLRIGYVSPDFRVHSVAYFLEPLMATLDRTQYEVTAYSDVMRRDRMTERIMKFAHRWRDIVGVSDERVAAMVREDGIDILVDLAGHTARNRMRVFASKPAPVQVSYLGYPNTTGLATVDYRLTDAIADPPGQIDRYYTETLVRLPNGFLCYHPSEDAPAVKAPTPALEVGHVTFGSFNNASKVTPEVIARWSNILRAIPGSRLIMKAKQLGDEATANRFRALFAERGIAAERLELYGLIHDPRGHLALYDRVDIGLDPFPYNGTTTTCEALWMGVPVVVLRGEWHAARVGASLLSSAGLPELIASDPDAYVEMGVALAGDLARCSELRKSLRRRLSASPLLDAQRFARDVESAYREMWQRWCRERARP